MEVQGYWLEFVASVAPSGGILVTFSWLGKDFLSSETLYHIFFCFVPSLILARKGFCPCSI